MTDSSPANVATPGLAAATALYISDAADALLTLEPVPAEQVVSGHPATGSVVLESIGGEELGVWEMTPGAMRDVEVNEVSVVVSGHATVQFDDDSILELHPGTVFRLSDGAHTLWTVSETLRKVYMLR